MKEIWIWDDPKKKVVLENRSIEKACLDGYRCSKHAYYIADDNTLEGL